MSGFPRTIGAGRRLAIIVVYVVVFWLVLPGALVVAGRMLDEVLGFDGEPNPLGLAALVPGFALLLWSGAELRRRGRGMPISALPPAILVTSGPYRTMRHPMYVGWNAAVFGLGVVIGMPALAWIIAPAVAPVWIAYALREERALARRFGTAYRRYKTRTGLVPWPSLYWVGRLLVGVLLPLKVEGATNIPRRGAAVLVPNHSCYLDPAFVARTTGRTIWFTTTAEVFRGRLAYLVRRLPTVPLRRYRPDPTACREVIRLLEEGELLCIFPEGERSPHGGRQAPIPDVARTIARLGAPVIPVIIIGAADVGPRWAEALRRRPVVVRAGQPVTLAAETAAQQIADAWAGLAGQNGEPIHLAGLDMSKINRILWRCPSCGSEDRFKASDLSCDDCGVAWRAREDGFLETQAGAITSLAAMARDVATFPEDRALEAAAQASVEAPGSGPLRPLTPLGDGLLRIDETGLMFDEVSLPLSEIRSVTTERSDTLQVATRKAMWQFVPNTSVFRLKNALDTWASHGVDSVADGVDAPKMEASVGS